MTITVASAPGSAAGAGKSRKASQASATARPSMRSLSSRCCTPSVSSAASWFPRASTPATVWPPSVALCIDLQLLGLFMAQHSGMARRGFKRVLTGHVPPLVERATYVLCASLVLILLFAAWQPLPATVWHGGSAGDRGDPVAVGARLADRARHVPDWPFQTAGAKAGGAELRRPRHVGGRVQDARTVSLRPAPALSRIYSRLLGDA